MIKEIRVYSAVVSSSFLGEKKYKKYDITNMVEANIADSARRNGVLDTTQISLLSYSRAAFKSLTRIIFDVLDVTNGVEKHEKIYRVVDNDNVKNVVMGQTKLYRHTLSLIEITKILERRNCDNLTFTNFLTNYGNWVEVRNIISKNNNGEVNWGKGKVISAGNFYEEGSDKFESPFHKLGENDTISTNVSPVINAVIEQNYHTSKVKASLIDYYVKTPTGQKQALTKESGFTFVELGTYEFVQVYKSQDVLDDSSSSIGAHFFRIEFELVWSITCLNENSYEGKTKKYNIKQVVERILKCHKVIFAGQENQEFILDRVISKKLSKIEAPEFIISEGTLFEALSQVGDYIHAKPRLKPNVIGDDDYSTWNVVSYDFLDDLDEYKDKAFSLIDLENPSEDYAKDFISNVQNATVTNYNNKFSVIEPCVDGFLSTRTESSLFEVSNDECIFKTRFKIRSIIKAELNCKGNIIDISDRIVEKAIYDLKSSYDANSAKEMKTYYLYYKQGNENIYGLSFTKEKGSFLSDKDSSKEAINNIVSSSGVNYNGYIKDLALRIEYVPFIDFKVRQYRTYLDANSEESTLYYNQQANGIDIEAYGENMHYALEKTGNEKLAKTYYFNSLFDIPKCGQYCIINGDKYVVYQVNREFTVNTPIKATVTFSKNYQELYSYLAVKNAIRQYEISEKECYNRNIDVQNYCIVDTELDLDKIYFLKYKNFSNFQKKYYKKLLNTGFGITQNIDNLVTHFKRSDGTSKKLLNSITATFTYYEDSKQVAKAILFPATFANFGRSIVCHFSTQDNYSAGTTVENDSEKKYAIENYLRYCNSGGRTAYMDFAIFQKFKEISNDKSLSASYNLYDLSNTGSGPFLYSQIQNKSAIFGKNRDETGSIILDKDSREKISVTCQLNFITNNKNIQIHKAFINSLPYTCDSNNTYKMAVFNELQNANSDDIVGKYYTLNSFSDLVNGNFDTSSIVFLGGKAGNNGKAYGIITNENKLCIVVNKNIVSGENLPPIYLMFRNKY